MSTILEDNIGCLKQGIALLERISQETYSESSDTVKGGSIGEHIRHNIDHYLSFLDGLAAPEIDYDARKRDPRIETDPQYAIENMQTIIQRLREINNDDGDKPIRIKMDSGSGAENSRSNSTPHRELQFLVSHTIHHYTLIAFLCRLKGIEPTAGFGVAPSTLKYRQQLQEA